MSQAMLYCVYCKGRFPKSHWPTRYKTRPLKRKTPCNMELDRRQAKTTVREEKHLPEHISEAQLHMSQVARKPTDGLVVDPKIRLQQLKDRINAQVKDDPVVSQAVAQQEEPKPKPKPTNGGNSKALDHDVLDLAYMIVDTLSPPQIKRLSAMVNAIMAA